MTDGKVRRLGSKQRLETSLFLTVNDAGQGLVIIISPEANVLSPPPVEYSPKTEILMIRRLESKRSGACCLIRLYAYNLTTPCIPISPVMVSCTGVAWLSKVSAVKPKVNSVELTQSLLQFHSLQ
jgi:hypothetical protein